MLLAVQLVWLARPAYACGCGAMVVDPKTTLSVNRETSAVRWDGKTEQIVMSLAVAGTARDAAWIMPVPHRATVKLGDSALFDELATLTAPADRKRSYFWPHSGDWPFSWGEGDSAEAPMPGGARPGVGVVGRQRLGPFDVARLTATDPEALRGWLRSHGFTLPSALAGALRPYVAQHWEYVAVRLAPDDKRGYPGYLTGTLDPLHLSFASNRLVYPMRLSRLAKTPQSLGLYVFAPHRMEPRSAIGGTKPQTFFAGRITPTGAVRTLTGPAPTYLTALDQHFPYPERITGDHELRRAPTDTPYRRVHYIDVLLKLGGIPAWLVVVGVALVLLHATALALALTIRRRARRRGAAAHESSASRRGDRLSAR
ncbi:hypothetical protein B1H19_13530 [Streptomyces gilvosporeus]|uniref:DUF2330 domain-containing protein n=2 Tax=Streptomyces gilvosporeus TaxID=553510 RepID=A0A1V0U2K6_9ACTN|nr:hypothetical protein B1H19_13530 [Streptomyces gilvosporeus]